MTDFNPQHLHLEPTRVFMVADKRPFGANRREGEEWLVNSSFPTFRTDSGKFRLRVKNTSGEVVAEFDLIHPSPPPFKNWQAEELPVTKTDGNLTVTLQRVQRPSETDRSKGLLWRFGLEEFITENGLPTKDWYFSTSNLEDPFGSDVHFGPKSFTGEPAWRLRLGARRKSDAEFPASETWELAEVPLPSKDTVQFRTDTHIIDGVTFKLALVAGSGHVSYSTPTTSLQPQSVQGTRNITLPIFETPVKVTWEIDESTRKIDVEANWPHIAFEVIGQSPGQEMLIKIRDSDGRPVATQRYPGQGFTYFIKTEPDAKSLTLLFIVSRGREFEFFIKPPESSEEKPMP